MIVHSRITEIDPKQWEDCRDSKGKMRKLKIHRVVMVCKNIAARTHVLCKDCACYRVPGINHLLTI